MIIARLALVFVGALLVVMAATRITWALWSWAWLSYHGHRPALYPDGPRVYYRADAMAAALGAALLYAALAI